MFMRSRTILPLVVVLILLVGALAAVPVGATPALSSASTLRQIPIGGTSAPQTGDYTPSGSGDVTQAELPGETDSAAGPAAYNGTIIARSFSHGTGHGASTNSSTKAKSNPQFNTGFEGLNFYQQRYARGGNQFSLEPPDQGLCVGNGYVFEAVNDVEHIAITDAQPLVGRLVAEISTASSRPTR